MRRERSRRSAAKAHNPSSRAGPELVVWLASVLGVARVQIPEELASYFGIAGVTMDLERSLHARSHAPERLLWIELTMNRVVRLDQRK